MNKQECDEWWNTLSPTEKDNYILKHYKQETRSNKEEIKKVINKTENTLKEENKKLTKLQNNKEKIKEVISEIENILEEDNERLTELQYDTIKYVLRENSELLDTKELTKKEKNKISHIKKKANNRLLIKQKIQLCNEENNTNLTCNCIGVVFENEAEALESWYNCLPRNDLYKKNTSKQDFVIQNNLFNAIDEPENGESIYPIHKENNSKMLSYYVWHTRTGEINLIKVNC